MSSQVLIVLKWCQALPHWILPCAGEEQQQGCIGMHERKNPSLGCCTIYSSNVYVIMLCAGAASAVKVEQLLMDS